MCLAAYLAVLGVGTGFAMDVHPLLRPLSVVLIALALAAWLSPKLVRRMRGLRSVSRHSS